MTRASARLGVVADLAAADVDGAWTIYPAPPASLDQVDGPTIVVDPVQLPNFEVATSCADRGEVNVTVLVSSADTDPDATWTELDDLADQVAAALVKAGHAPLSEQAGSYESRFPCRVLTIEVEV